MARRLGALLHRLALPRRRRQSLPTRVALRPQHHLQRRAGSARRRTSTSPCRPRVARELPEPLLRLMGYARGAYALGYVDDLRDPLDVLMGRDNSTGSFAAGTTVLADNAGVATNV